MINRIADHVFPIGGGSLGAIFGGVILNPQHILHVAIDAAILAIVGGIVGFLTKLILDRIFPRRDKSKHIGGFIENENNKK